MTKPLLDTTDAALLRTDFSDDRAWEAICAEARAPYGMFMASVVCVSDPAFEGLTPNQLLALTGSYRHTFIFMADRRTITDPEHREQSLDLQHGFRGIRRLGRSGRGVPGVCVGSTASR